MARYLSADDVLPLVACLTTRERLRLLRLISRRPGGDDGRAYRASPVGADEFSSDEDRLAWDAGDWEDVG